MGERAGGGLLVVVGPSGCGKSSLVRAGLVPAMAGEAMRRRRAVDVLELGRLSPAQVLAVAADCLGGSGRLPDGLGPLLARADGLPFLVEELLAAAYEGGALRETAGSWAFDGGGLDVLPAGYVRTIEGRLAVLGPAATRLVRVAALLGRVVDVPLTAAAAGAAGDGDGAFLAALHAASDAGIVACGPGDRDVSFRHDLVREAVLAGCPPGVAADLAGRALSALLAARPRLEDPWLEAAIELSLRAGDLPGAARLTVRLGRAALAGGGLATARDSALRAASLTGDPHVRSQAAGLLFTVAERTGDVRLAAAAAADWETGGGPAGRDGHAAAALHAHLGVAAAAVAATDWRLAAARLDAAAQLLAAAGSATLASSHRALAAEVAVARGHLDEARRHAEDAVRLAAACGNDVAACRALRLTGRLVRGADLDRAAAVFTEALRVAQAGELVHDELQCLTELGVVDMLRDGRTDGLVAARDRAARLGAVATAAVVDLQVAGAAAVCFDAGRALDVGRRCLDAARRYRLTAVLPMALVQIATARAVAGDEDACETALREAFRLAPDAPDVAAAGWGHARLVAALVREDRAAALDAADRAVAASRLAGRTVPGMFWAPWALLHLLSSPEDGPRVASVLEAADVGGIPVNAALRRFPVAVLAARGGQPATACRLVEEADAALRALPQFEGWHQLCRRLTAEAALADGWGEPVAWLRAALGYFDDSGHHAIARACRGVLGRSGAAVPRRDRRGAAPPPALRAVGITSREAQVLQLVAAGLSNRQVADSLVLSPRTVEKHVERLLMKTTSGNRTQLAAWAVAHDHDGRPGARRERGLPDADGGGPDPGTR